MIAHAMPGPAARLMHTKNRWLATVYPAKQRSFMVADMLQLARVLASGLLVACLGSSGARAADEPTSTPGRR